MGRHRLSSPEMAVGGAIPDPFPPHLQWPFGRLDALTRDEVRSSAYEIFFTACRSTSAGGRLAVAGDNHEGQGTKASAGAKNMVVASRLKRSLGLRARRMRSMVGARPMTSAEIMRRQMGVSEQTDGLVRKTLARCLVGPQMPKKVESLVLPMELLRRLKASEFADAGEYRSWQLRQLKLLEAGLVLHPFVPLDKSPAASSVSEMIRSTEPQIDVRALSATVMALAWRCSVEVCHWADGYPLNVHLYLSLLRAVFDLRDETVVLDEVDELLELIKKTWSMLGLNRMIHNVCFTWVLFERYVTTGQIEPDLLSATLVMLQHVSEDARKAEREPGYSRVLSATLASVYSWADNKLLDYHEAFDKSSMKNAATLAVLAAELLGQHAPAAAGSPFAAADLIERYIKSSVRRVFAKLDESGNAGGGGSSMLVEVEEDPGEALRYVAAQTKEMARVEKDVYSPILRQWHPCPAAIAAVTLHSCFGVHLKQYVSKMAGCLSSESMRVLQTASELDKYLVQMAHDDDDDEDGSVSKQMIPYDIDSIIVGLVTEWMDDRLRIGAECVRRARDSETWNPSSKSEPFAQSAVDLMKLAKATVDELMEIHQQRPMPELVQHLVDGIDHLVQRYALFVASSCGGSKESYIPPLPPLTRCNQDSRLLHQLLLNLNCGVVGTEAAVVTATRVQQRVVRPTTSSATQRLYVRLNTLHYLLGVLRSIDRSVAPRGQRHVVGHRRARSSSFDHAYPAVDAAIAHVTELSAYRLVFLDSAPYYHQALYQGGVAGARIRPVLRVMKQNLAFLGNVVGERAQPLAVREVMKASVEAFLVVLLAGGSRRAFSREDHGAVAEDFTGLKRLLFCCGDGLVTEEVVEAETAAAEGVVDLMALPTEKLIEEFGRLSGGTGRMPPTRRWSRWDACTVLRVLCHRDDEAASRFLKKTFELPKRR